MSKSYDVLSDEDIGRWITARQDGAATGRFFIRSKNWDADKWVPTDFLVAGFHD